MDENELENHLKLIQNECRKKKAKLRFFDNFIEEHGFRKNKDI